MRVIAGLARGHVLLGPPRGTPTRPTSEKVRAALFNIVAASLPGARVLDPFAGTGALGIEALSRGAAHATFVEQDRALCAVIRRNLDATHLAGSATVVCRDIRRATTLLAADGPFDLVLIDPPYQLGLERDAIAVLSSAALLAPGARVIIEHARRSAIDLGPWERVLERESSRDYGDTTLACYVANDTAREIP